jgi:DNA-binding transcriptional LysR family regulator
MLLQGEIDFSVSTPSASFEASPEIECRRLFEDRDQPHVRPEHPLVRRTTVTLKDLADFPWIFSSRYAGDRERVLRKFATAEVRPPGQMVLTDYPGIIHELLVGHDFIHVNGSSFYSRAFSHVKVVTLEVPELIVGRAGVVMTRQGGRMAPASRALLDLFLKIWSAAATEDTSASANKAVVRLRK